MLQMWLLDGNHRTQILGHIPLLAPEAHCAIPGGAVSHCSSWVLDSSMAASPG